MSAREEIEADVAAFLAFRFPNVETVDLQYRTHCFKAALS